MLLPNQIRDNEFTYSKGMYKADEVDAFLEEVYESYDRTFRENAELIKKLEVLANKVEEYRKDENSIGSALMAAQRAADQLTKEAQAKADEIKSMLMQIRDAEREAVVAANAPKASVKCPYCGAVVVPAADGSCEFCGSVIGV